MATAAWGGVRGWLLVHRTGWPMLQARRELDGPLCSSPSASGFVSYAQACGQGEGGGFGGSLARARPPGGLRSAGVAATWRVRGKVLPQVNTRRWNGVMVWAVLARHAE
jgi:hypothetical protein